MSHVENIESGIDTIFFHIIAACVVYSAEDYSPVIDFLLIGCVHYTPAGFGPRYYRRQNSSVSKMSGTMNQSVSTIGKYISSCLFRLGMEDVWRGNRENEAGDCR